MWRVILAPAFLFPVLLTQAQNPPGPPVSRLTIEECYTLGEANYPIIRQRGLIARTESYTLDNLSKNIYPQLAVDGAATYQSDVTKIAIPLPGYKVPEIPKNQYKISGEVTQTLTDFGITRQQKEISRTDAALQEQNLNTQLYALRDRLNQMFFGVLLIDGQIEQNALSKANLQVGIDQVQAAINNGTDYRSSLNKLQAEQMETDQRTIELWASRRAYTDMLSLFLAKAVDDSTHFITPEIPSISDAINRPELKAYDLQILSYQEQQRLTRRDLLPHLNAFFQGGFGKPSPVNFLATQFAPYYITGLRLSWDIHGLYTYRKDILTSKDNEQMTQADKDSFLFNTGLSLREESADIRKYRALMASDDEIIRLRVSVSKASAAQLANGVINANNYLQDVNAEALARQAKVLHQVQLLISQYDHKTTSGN